MLRRFVGLLVTALMVLALAGAPVRATGGTTVHYIALGDSVSAGYQPNGAPRSDGFVGRLHRGLPREDTRTVLHNLACDGATTTSLLTGPGCATAEPQLVAAERLLRAYPASIRLVTIDVGANNVGRCVRRDRVDEACVRAGLAVIAAELPAIVGRLRTAGGPNVRIVGMTYYNPHVSAWLSGAGGQARARQSAPLAEALNQALREAYAGVRVADVGAAFASTDLDDRAGVPLAVTRVCAWTWMCRPDGPPDIHPNSAGHQVIADAFAAQIR